MERGSPATVIFYDHELNRAYLVDPGQGEDRPRRLKRSLEQLGNPEYHVVLTHYHSDHLEAIAKLTPVEVVATDLDSPAVRRPDIRAALTYGMYLDPNDKLMMFRAPQIAVTKEVPASSESSYGRLRLIPLPGHTEGHMGVLTPDGVLHAGDAIFGDRTIAKYGIPYHRRLCTARESLESLARLAPSLEYVVPGHGPVVRGSEASALIELNIKRLDEVANLIESSLREPIGIDQLVASLVKAFSPQELEPANLLLLRTTVEGYISCLRSREAVEPVIVNGSLLWRLRP